MAEEAAAAEVLEEEAETRRRLEYRRTLKESKSCKTSSLDRRGAVPKQERAAPTTEEQYHSKTSSPDRRGAVPKQEE